MTTTVETVTPLPAVTPTQATIPAVTTEKSIDSIDSPATDDHEYPSTRKAVTIIIGLFLSVFLVALDRLIIGIAIPTITKEFHSLDDVGWYGSAYLLTASAFCLFFGKLYQLYNPKTLFLASILLFEIGSAICGAAPNSVSLIVGRAIAGLGSGGMLQGAFNILIPVVPLHKRPVVFGLFGAVFGLASVLGPILGGAFTDGPGWRWCFYINLPIGAVTIAALAFFLHIPVNKNKKPLGTWVDQLRELDPVGTLLFLPAIICLVLALQWGGITYTWSNWRIIVLFVLAGVLLIGFVVVQFLNGERATVPGRIFFNRSILAGMWFSFTNYGGMMAFVYFVSIWFQAVKGSSAVHAGIMQLPLVLGLMAASIPCGILIKKIGYYTPFMILSSVLTPIGMGLITTWTPSTTHPAWIGYQVLVGAGIGCGMQAPALAAQTVLSKQDIPIGTALVTFGQTLGGTLFIAVAGNLFNTRLIESLTAVEGLNAVGIISSGAVGLRNVVTPEELPVVLEIYNHATRGPFYLATALAVATIIGSLTMKWTSVKTNAPSKEKNDSTVRSVSSVEKV